jgi:hypothetical protein
VSPIRTFTIVGFIAAVAVLAIFVGTRRTILDGEVMAGYIRRSAPVVRCQDAELLRTGALFTCTLQGAAGDTYEREYFMNRDGTIYDAGNAGQR